MKAFEELYQGHYRDVFCFLSRLCGFHDDLAEELTQDTFYHAYLSLPRFRGECTVKSWLFAIAKKRFFLWLRKQKHASFPLSDHLAEIIDEQAPDPSDNLYQRRLLEDAFAVIFSFREPMKSIFLLRIYCQTPYKELADRFCLTESASKVLFHRGKRLLQTKLKEEYGYDIHLPSDR